MEFGADSFRANRAAMLRFLQVYKADQARLDAESTPLPPGETSIYSQHLTTFRDIPTEDADNLYDFLSLSSYQTAPGLKKRSHALRVCIAADKFTNADGRFTDEEWAAIEPGRDLIQRYLNRLSESGNDPEIGDYASYDPRRAQQLAGTETGRPIRIDNARLPRLFLAHVKKMKDIYPSPTLWEAAEYPRGDQYDKNRDYVLVSVTGENPSRKGGTLPFYLKGPGGHHVILINRWDRFPEFLKRKREENGKSLWPVWPGQKGAPIALTPDELQHLIIGNLKSQTSIRKESNLCTEGKFFMKAEQSLARKVCWKRNFRTLAELTVTSGASFALGAGIGFGVVKLGVALITLGSLSFPPVLFAAAVTAVVGVIAYFCVKKLIKSPIFVKKASPIIPRNYKTAFLFSSKQPESPGFKRREALTLFFNDMYTKLQDAEKFPQYQGSHLKAALNKWKAAETKRPDHAEHVFFEHFQEIIWPVLEFSTSEISHLKWSWSKIHAHLPSSKQELFSSCTKDIWEFVSKFSDYGHRNNRYDPWTVIRGQKRLRTLEHFAQIDQEVPQVGAG